MRTLASIKRISGIQSIEGKDRIVLAQVDGWNVIVRKDEYKPGDLCVYVEIDSVMPEKPEFEFLRPKKFRIKTMSMGGVISQGICFPLNILPARKGGYYEDDDVTEVLGVKQYEATMDVESESKTVQKSKWPRFLMRWKWFRKLVLPKKQAKEFPSFISKTDETRVQNMPWVLQDKGLWIATEKIDGQSGTFALVRNKSRLPWKKDTFEYIVCSRNLRLWTPDKSSYWQVSEKYSVRAFLEDIIGDHDWVAIQGECIGPGVQKNKYCRGGYELYVFNVVYPNGRLDSITARDVCEYGGMKFVPIVSEGMKLPRTVDEALKFAHGTSKLTDVLREGIVFRSLDGKQSFKAVDPLFLIQHDE